MRNIQKYFNEKLEGLYPPNEVKSLCQIALQELRHCSKASLLAASPLTLSDEEKKSIDQTVARLLRHEPIQYILGKSQFYGLEFVVNESVLIPRPETEELVEWIMNDAHGKRPNATVADLCTGSGCIAIALKQHRTDFRITAVDLSEEALATAQHNAEKNRCDIRFVHDDILAPSHLEGERFDIIASNPPYIKEEERAAMEANVLEFEPEMALFVPNENPLLFYEAIAQFGQKHLNEGGQIYFEINEALGNETVGLLERMGYGEVTLRKDIFGKDRMVRATLKSTTR